MLSKLHAYTIDLRQKNQTNNLIDFEFLTEDLIDRYL